MQNGKWQYITSLGVKNGKANKEDNSSLVNCIAQISSLVDDEVKL
jgi:hypothetical protein